MLSVSMVPPAPPAWSPRSTRPKPGTWNCTSPKCAAPSLPVFAKTAGAGAAGTAAALDRRAPNPALGQLEAQISRVCDFYSGQCDAFLRAAGLRLRENADGTGASLVQFSRPSAGMFVWMRLLGIPDSFSLVTGPAREAGER